MASINITKKEKELQALRIKKKQLQNREHQIKLSLQRQKRKDDTRLKILFGAFLIKILEGNTTQITPKSFFLDKDIKFILQYYPTLYKKLEEKYPENTQIIDMDDDFESGILSDFSEI